MALPKHLARIEQKLDRVLAILEQAPVEMPPPQALDPNELAALLEWDTYNAKELLSRIPSLTLEQRDALVTYEQAHANRKTVLQALGLVALG